MTDKIGVIESAPLAVDLWRNGFSLLTIAQSLGKSVEEVQAELEAAGVVADQEDN